MSVAHERLGIRIAEAEACITAVGDNQFAARILAARVVALRDAQAEMEADWDEDEDDADAEAPAAEDAAEPAEPGTAHVRKHGLSGEVAVGHLADDALAAQDETPPAAGRKRRRRAVIVYTDERLELLRTLWIDPKVTTEQILTRINTLSGRKVQSVNALRKQAQTMNLPARPTDAFWTEERRAKQRANFEEIRKLGAAARQAKRADPAPPPAPPAPPAPPVARPPFDPANPLAGLDADEIADAREIVVSKGEGARALHDYFGWSLTEAQAIGATLRAQAVPQRAADSQEAAAA